MKKLLILGLLIILYSLLFTKESENILEINGESIYFSFNGRIKSSYINIDRQKYDKILKTYYNETIKNIKNKPRSTTLSVDLPDSLCIDYLKIKKGYKSIQFNSPRMYQFTVEGFKTVPNDFIPTQVLMMALPDSIVRNWKNLFFISQKLSTLKQIKSNSLVRIQDNNKHENIKNIISNYLVENRKVLNSQMKRNFQLPDSLNSNQILTKISSWFEFQIFELDNNFFFINGIQISSEYHPFIALIEPEKNEVEFRRRTRLIDSFKILDNNYLYCEYTDGGSGPLVYLIYHIKDKRFETIFSDSALSE